ncbi:MAG: hypothetical protein R3A13_08770 [Bdellovibrionota bacterium]
MELRLTPHGLRDDNPVTFENRAKNLLKSIAKKAIQLINEAPANLSERELDEHVANLIIASRQGISVPVNHETIKSIREMGIEGFSKNDSAISQLIMFLRSQGTAINYSRPIVAEDVATYLD